MNRNSTAQFWEQSWKSIDRERISSYAKNFDTKEDAIINFLKQQGSNHICDAGCGCGLYSLKLVRYGLSVSGFDIAEDAVLLTKKLLSENGYPANGFKQADILSTGYADCCFDAVVARDVVDHMPIIHGIQAVKELSRIVRPGGCVVLTLDAADDEYESEPHEINENGDYLFIQGKWSGMVFHPYSPREIKKLTAGLNQKQLLSNNESFIVVLNK